MIALDTNVLVRYLAQDDAEQALAATHLIEEELSARRPGFLSVIVVCEILWALEDCYAIPKECRIIILRELLAAPQLVVEHAGAVKAAMAHDGDLSDAIMHELGRARGCERTVTFDKKFARIDGVELLPAPPRPGARG